MNIYFNTIGFDITSIIEQYQGKKLEELFPDHCIIQNEMGEFMEFVWKEDEIPTNIPLLATKNKLLRNLKTVYYIGEQIESKLMKRGIRSLYDLKSNIKYQESANEIINLIENKEYKNLCENKYINDLDAAFCFEIEDLLFLDIESLGLYDSPMIIIGIGFYNNNKFEIHLLFARDIEEEIAICEHFRTKILPNFKCFISYNGKSFDIPYIANRFLYYFDENPMISEEDTPFKDSNTKFHHIDLYHNCRRHYKGQFNNYTLTNMEAKLLNWERDNELPSSLVGYCYRKYKKNPERYIGLIRECIVHNYYDIFSLPLIFNKLLSSK